MFCFTFQVRAERHWYGFKEESKKGAHSGSVTCPRMHDCTSWRDVWPYSVLEVGWILLIYGPMDRRTNQLLPFTFLLSFRSLFYKFLVIKVVGDKYYYFAIIYLENYMVILFLDLSLSFWKLHLNFFFTFSTHLPTVFSLLSLFY